MGENVPRAMPRRNGRRSVWRVVQARRCMLVDDALRLCNSARTYAGD